MKVQGMTNPGSFTVERIPGTNKSLVRLFQNVTPCQTDGFSGYEYDEYHVEVETWDGVAQNVLDNYNVFLRQGMDNEVDRSNAALREGLDAIAPGVEAAAVAFCLMAEVGQIDAATAGERAALFSQWAPGVDYQEGRLRRRGGALYRCLQAHRSQEGWEPENAPSLWRLAHDPGEAWPEWSQPICAGDEYGRGAGVTHAGERWVSEVDGNVWEPGVYGWSQAAPESGT